MHNAAEDAERTTTMPQSSAGSHRQLARGSYRTVTAATFVNVAVVSM